MKRGDIVYVLWVSKYMPVVLTSYDDDTDMWTGREPSDGTPWDFSPDEIQYNFTHLIDDMVSL